MEFHWFIIILTVIKTPVTHQLQLFITIYLTEKCKDHNLLHLHGWRTTAGGLVEESVLDNLSQHSVEDLGGDLARVGGGFGEFVL